MTKVHPSDSVSKARNKTQTVKKDKIRYFSVALIVHQLLIFPLTIAHGILSARFFAPLPFFSTTNQTTASSYSTFLADSYVATLVLLFVGMVLSIIGAIYANVKIRRVLQFSILLFVMSFLFDFIEIALEFARIILLASLSTFFTPFVVFLMLLGAFSIPYFITGAVLKVFNMLLVLRLLRDKFLF